MKYSEGRKETTLNGLVLKCAEEFSGGFGEVTQRLGDRVVDIIPGSILYNLARYVGSPEKRKERITPWTYGCAAVHMATIAGIWWYASRR